MTLPKAYREALRLSPSDVVDISTTLNLAGIDKGIIFFLARWSGKSQVSFRSLNRALESHTCDGLKLYIGDVDDDHVQRLMTSAGVLSTGGGETLWIRNGSIVGSIANYADDEYDRLVALTAMVCTHRDA